MLAASTSPRAFLPSSPTAVAVLHLSEPVAYNRIEAARAARRFPAILQMLGEGSLSLATLRLLSA